MPDPRLSTDENAPLLADDEGDLSDDPEPRSSFLKDIYNGHRPLTVLEKALAGVAILLLLLLSTFIGLFAGSEHLLHKERAKSHHTTVTATATATATATTTATTTVPVVPTGKPSTPVCVTADCVVLAASIIKALNTSVDPCDDFYEFAVGGWEASNSIPADRGLFGAFSEVSDNNKKIIVSVLESLASDSSELAMVEGPEADNLRKLNAVYTSCMDVGTLDDIGLKPFLPLANFVIDSFAAFDINPLPALQSLDDDHDTADWRGSYNEDYVLPESLRDSGEHLKDLRRAKRRGASSTTRQEEKLAIAKVELKPAPVEKERRDKLTTTLAWLHARGVDALINFEIEGDAGGEDSQIQSLWVYQSFGGLPSKEYYEEAPILDLYQSVVAGILIDIANATTKATAKRDIISGLAAELIETEGWPWPWPGDDTEEPPKQADEPLEVRMDKLAEKVVKFERKLMRAGADPEYLFNPHFAYNPYATGDVGAALPFLDLPAYLSTFAPRLFPANLTVTHPPYLSAVTKLVADTPDHVLSAYFITTLALTYAPALGPKVGIRTEKRRLEEVLRGIKPGTVENRQDVCLAWVDSIVGFIAGREFVREAFSPEAKADGEGIIKSIVTAFHDKLPHVSWMDAESAAAAQKKAEAIIPKVGYPLYPDTMNPASLASWYGRLTVDADDFFGTVLGSTLIEESRIWLSLGRQRNRNSWDMYPQTVNAYYSPPDGEIVFPAGILQPPFYSVSWPAHLRYGAFGAVAAHELTHAFDNSGAQYDEKGRLRDWWTNSTVEAFEERAQCVAKQYSSYYVLDADGKKVHVNGNLTNGEDIADSGLAQAYAAWRATLDTSSPAVQLPGLDFTPDQLFFLAFARVWAQLTRPATAVARVRTDPHSPPYWRATGTLRNLGAFHDAFNCKAGSGMRPAKKDQCPLW